jgi:hypothetical protein
VKQDSEVDSTGVVVEESGPAPFVTRRVFLRSDGSHRVWSSRHHRKSLVVPEKAKPAALADLLVRSAWMPRELNWWIGTVFALGSALFAAASILSLTPALAERLSLSVAAVNAVFFAGSVPFTTAAYLQLFQAANPDSQSEARAIHRLAAPERGMAQLSAAVEVCHGYWAWRLRQLSWWVVFANLLGCLGFMVAAVFGVFLPAGDSSVAVTLSLAFTLQGAICFFIGSVLMLSETAFEEKETEEEHGRKGVGDKCV